MSVLQKRGLTTVGKGVRQGKNYFVLLEVMQRRHVAHVLSVTDVLFVNALTVGIDRLETTILTTQSSCRCGANNKNGGEEVKSFSDTIGKRRTKCKCYKEMRQWTNKCGCYGCSNDYGRREARNVSSPQKSWNIKCTSSPSSLKRKWTDKFLSDNDFEIKQGSWTTEMCLLEAVILRSYPSSFVRPKTCRQLLKRRRNDWVTWPFIAFFLGEKKVFVSSCYKEPTMNDRLRLQGRI